MSEEHKDEQAAPTAPDADDHNDVGQLQQQLQAKTAEAHRNYDLYVRERAEVENFKKRMQREKNEALRFASESLVRDLLTVVDNLERAVEHADREDSSVIEGVQLVLKSLHDILERHGVKRIEAVGEPFDPAQHEAMAQIESAEHEPNHVVDQHHRGYRLHDRLLRPALVTVSKKKSKPDVESDSNND